MDKTAIPDARCLLANLKHRDNPSIPYILPGVGPSYLGE